VDEDVVGFGVADFHSIGHRKGSRIFMLGCSRRDGGAAMCYRNIDVGCSC